MGFSISRKKQNQTKCSKSILKTRSASLNVDMPDSGRIPKIAINQTKIHKGMVFQNKLLYPEMEDYSQSETQRFTTLQFIKSRYIRSEDPSSKSTRNISIVKCTAWNREDSQKNSVQNFKSPSPSPPPCLRKSTNSFVSCSSNSAKKVTFNMDEKEVFQVQIKKERRKKQKITMDDLVNEF